MSLMDRAVSAEASADVLAEAARAARDAAAQADVEVRSLSSHTELGTAGQLLTDVWQRHFPEDLLRAFVLSGNFVAGAFSTDGTMVGASAGWAAVGPEPELHSHVTGVAAECRRSGVGVVLKLFQRSWALERGMRIVSWTFDPLLRRNARFNLARLGAAATGYLENIYGDMDDALNRHDESDRLWVCWRLDDPGVVAAAAGTPRHVAVPAGAGRALGPGPGDRPVVGSTGQPAGAFTCAVPGDVESMRSTDPELAAQWRLELRRVLGGALRSGGTVLGLDASGDYVVMPACSAEPEGP